MRSIRFKMWAALVILLLPVFILAMAGLYAVGLYRNIVDDVGWHAEVIPEAGTLGRHVGELRTVLGELRGIRRTRLRLSPLDGAEDRLLLEGKFQNLLFQANQSSDNYQQLLKKRQRRDARDLLDNGSDQEDAAFKAVGSAVEELKEIVSFKDWGGNDKLLEEAETNLKKLQQLAETLPAYLHDELGGYSRKTKRQARWLNGLVVTGLTISAVLVALLVRLSYAWIFKPLRILIDGSRRIAGGTVADGTFRYRIQLPSRDEMAELAEAMNQMTERFEEIRQDLDLKVQQRSQELIRSERLASVGFLAAGVAHEINNPLAAISTCAESLQRRIVPLLPSDAAGTDTALATRYLKMIQDEAFRCKGITEKLLSFARSERKKREPTDLAALIVEMVEMTRQHDSFKRKNIRLNLPAALPITANPQELKQVVLNLLANALHSTDEEGGVEVRLRRENDRCVLEIEDNGVGMDEETLKNIFEPFFTRREHGQGTGLGLSITHRIIEDHRGRITARSAGLGRGSVFVVELPVESY